MSKRVSFLNLGLPVLMILVLILSACSRPAAVHTYYVTTTGDDSNDCLSVEHACRTILSAVSKATPGSTIRVGAGTFTANLTISKFLTIIGEGMDITTLTNGDLTPIIAVANDVHFHVESLSIVGGRTGIEVNGTSISTQVSALNVKFQANDFSILSEKGSAVLVNYCSFYITGTGIISFRGKLDVINSLFRRNNFHAIVTSSNTTLDHVGIDSSGAAGAAHSYQFGAVLVTGADLDPRGSSGIVTITASQIGSNPSDGLVIMTGTVKISTSQIDGNAGNGIINYGTLTIDSSTVMNNGVVGIKTGPGFFEMTRTIVYNNTAGGIWIEEGGKASITNSTIAGNPGDGIQNRGDAILAFDTIAYNALSGFANGGRGNLDVQNSIIALNSEHQCYPSGPSYVVDRASLACDEGLGNYYLRLGGLVHEAGTYVIPLQDGSPAINHASGDCPATDQRGSTRPSGSACDVGAYEFGAGLHLEASTPGAETPTLPVYEIVTETPTVGLVSPRVTFQTDANCRKGPGTAYDIVTSFNQGQTLDAVGRNDQSSWWLVNNPAGGTCWVGHTVVTTLGAVDGLPVQPAPVLPDMPAKLDAPYTCNVKLTTMPVDLSWGVVSGESGYHVYRNGTLLTTVDASTTSYHDEAPLGTDLTYEVEAYNTNGVGPRVSATVPACK